MTDVDPKIWENPTLGAVGAGPFLDEVEAQSKEDYNARREGREPRVAYHVDRYPKYAELNVPSGVSTYEMLEPGTSVDEVVVEDNLPVEEDSIVPDSETEFDFSHVDEIIKETGNDDSNSTE